MAPSRSWISAVREDEDQKPAEVRQDVTFPAFDLLVSLITAMTAAFCDFYRLAVDDAGTGRGFAPLDLAQVQDQHRVHRVERARAAPGVEIPLNRLGRREIFRQQPPGTAASSDIR